MFYFDFELCLDALFLGSFGFVEDVFMEYAHWIFHGLLDLEK